MNVRLAIGLALMLAALTIGLCVLFGVKAGLLVCVVIVIFMTGWWLTMANC